ncbi:hypothetical protein GIB67_034317, partial [Kingdonia uniflora]
MTLSHTRFQRGSSSIRQRFSINTSTPIIEVSYVMIPVHQEDDNVDDCDVYLLAKVYFDCKVLRFHYMVIVNDRQKVMPMLDDRLPVRGNALAYPKAALLTNPINPDLKGEVDDKYEYSIENKDNRVHGWVSSDPPIRFRQITPSDEFRTGGSVKQNLISHVGPTTLAVVHIIQAKTWYQNSKIESRGKRCRLKSKVVCIVFQFLRTSFLLMYGGTVTGRLLVYDRATSFGLKPMLRGFIGDYKYDEITITAGYEINLDVLVYEPPRDSPTLWEMGVPDHSEKGFYVSRNIWLRLEYTGLGNMDYGKVYLLPSRDFMYNIVMRKVRNIVNTGHTIVCTIHQPSTYVFKSFDELLFMKRGQLIYVGPLGAKFQKLVKFFEGIEGVQEIRFGYNPAAWMLEVTSSSEENRLVLILPKFTEDLVFQQNRQLIETLSKPSSDTKDLSFPAKYSKPFLNQFLASLWKQNLSYWRNPQYTVVWFFYTLIIS